MLRTAVLAKLQFIASPSEISVSQGNYFTKIIVSSLLQQLLNLEGVVVMVSGWRCQW